MAFKQGVPKPSCTIFLVGENRLELLQRFSMFFLSKMVQAQSTAHRLVSPPRRNQAQPSKEVYQICIASTALPCKESFSTSLSSPYGALRLHCNERAFHKHDKAALEREALQQIPWPKKCAKLKGMDRVSGHVATFSGLFDVPKSLI